jgi:hypothetical protein
MHKIATNVAFRSQGPIEMPAPPRPFRLEVRVTLLRAARLRREEAWRCTLRNRLPRAHALEAEAQRLLRAIIEP